MDPSGWNVCSCVSDCQNHEISNWFNMTWKYNNMFLFNLYFLDSQQISQPPISGFFTSWKPCMTSPKQRSRPIRGQRATGGLNPPLMGNRYYSYCSARRLNLLGNITHYLAKWWRQKQIRARVSLTDPSSYEKALPSYSQHKLHICFL